MQESNKIRFRKIIAHRIVDSDNESESKKYIYKILISYPQICYRWVEPTKLNPLIRSEYHSNLSYEYIDVGIQTEISENASSFDQPSYNLPKPILTTVRDISNSFNSSLSNSPFPISIISIDYQQKMVKVKYNSTKEGNISLQDIKLLYPKLLAEFLLEKNQENSDF